MKSHRYILLLLILVACYAAAGGVVAADPQQIDSAAAVEFRRVYTPTDQLEEMPRDHVRYVPMKAEQFEQLLATGHSPEDGDAAGATSIASAEYVARLTPEETLEGDATLEVVHHAPGDAVLPLEPCAIAISEARWETPEPRAARIGLSPDGKLEAIVDQSAKLRWRWSFRGSRDSGGVLRFPLQLPAAPSNSMLLELPADLDPSVNAGVVTRESSENAETRRWRIQLGGQGRVDLRIASNEQAEAGRQLVLARYFLVYDVSLRGIELSAELRLDVHHAPIRELAIALDPGLDLIAARYGESAVRWSVLSRPRKAEGVRLLLELPEPVQGTGRIIKLRAIGPVHVDRRWRLPGLHAEGTSWQEGNATVAVRTPLSLDQLNPSGGRQSKTGTLSAPRPGETADVQYFSEEAGVDVLVATVKARVRLTSGTTVELGSGEITAKTVAELSVAEGELFQLEADIGRQWLIDSVRSDPPEVLGDGWSVKRDTRRLMLQLDQALSPARPIRLIVSGRRLHSPLGRPLTIQDLTPLEFLNVLGQRHLLAMRTVEPYRLKLEGTDQLTRVLPGTLQPAEQRLFLQPPGEILLQTDAGAKRLKVSLATPKPSYSATLAVEATLTERTLAESYRLRIVPDDAHIDRLRVHFSVPRAESPTWSIGNRGDDPHSTRRLSATEQAAAGLDTQGETWEIAFATPKASPFEIGAARVSDWAGTQPISLAGVPQADRQQGSLIIRATKGRTVRATDARLDCLPIPQEPYEKQNTAIAAYRYDPATDATNAADAAVTVTVEPTGLPLAWAWSCLLQTRYEADGTTRHTAIYRVESAGKPNLILRMPLGAVDCRTLVVYPGSSPATWRRAAAPDRRILLDLPPGQRFPVVAVHFAMPAGRSETLDVIDAPLPAIDAPVLSQNWRVWLPPGYGIAEPRQLGGNLRLTWPRRLFGPLAPTADSKLWDAQSVPRSAAAKSVSAETPGPWPDSPHFEEDPSDEMGWTAYRIDISPGIAPRLTVIRRDVHRVIVWLAMLAALALSWWIAGTRPARVVAILCAAAAAALLLPDFYAPFASGAVWGSLACLGFLLLRSRRRQTSAESSSIRTGFPPIERRAELPGSLAVALMVTAGLAGAACADDSTAAADQPSRVVHNVLIPVDAQEEPTGGSYYVPEALYQELLRGSDSGVDAPLGWLLRAASYRGVLARQSGPETLVMAELKAVFDLEVLSPAATVRIPLGREGVNLLADGATLDGQSVQLEWRDNDQALAIEIAEPGEYRLELALRPLTQSIDGQRVIRLRIPRLATSRVEIDLPSNAPVVDIPSAEGSVVRQQEPPRVLAELGAVDHLEVRWLETAAAAGGDGPAIDVEQLLWLRVHPGSIVLTTRLKMKVVNGAVRRLRLSADPRLRLLPFREAGNPIAQVQATAGQPQTVQLELAAPLEDQAVVELSFLLTGASGIGNVRLPRLELEGARTVKRWMAVSVDPALVYEQQQGGQLEPVPPPEFEVAWGKAESQPRFAYNLASAQPDWSLATWPDEPHVLIDQVLAVSFAPGSARVQFDAQLATTGYEFQYRVLAPAELLVERVSVREEAVERAARWSRDENGAVVIFLNGPAAEKQQLSLVGRLPAPLNGRLALPQLRVEGTEMRSCEIQLFRDSSVLVEVVKSAGLVDVELPIVGGEKAELGRLVKWFTVADCERQTEAELTISPNRPEIAVKPTIRLHHDQGAWRADVDCRIVVRRGVADEFRLRVPPQWSGPYRVTPNVSLTIFDSPEDRRRELILRPRLAVAGEYRLQISSPLTPVDGESVRIPHIQMLDAQVGRTICVLPATLQGQAISWNTRGLEPVGLSPEMVPADLSESLIAFESDDDSFQAILDPSPPAVRTPEVLLADVHLAWHGDGTYRARAIFDLQPAGKTHLPLSLPDHAKLVYLRVAGVSVAPEEEADSSWRFRLVSRAVPQRIEVLYCGRLSSPVSGGPIVLEAPSLGPLPVRQTLWTVFSPKDYRPRPGGLDPVDEARLDLIRLKALALAWEQAAESAAGESDADGGWNRLWLSRWIAARGRLQRRLAAGVPSPERREYEKELPVLDERFAALVKRSHDSDATTPGSRQLDGESSLIQTALGSASPAPACYALSPGASSLTIAYESERSEPVWHRMLLGAACLALVPFTLVRRMRRGATAWLVRWAGVFGVLAGLIWWLFLEPAALGWLMVLFALICVAISRWWKSRRPATEVGPIG